MVMAKLMTYLVLSEINIKSSDIMVYFIKENPDDIKNCCSCSQPSKKWNASATLSRTLPKRPFFYIEAKVIKHLASGKDADDN
ncbi:MAG: hypothetical protein QM786_17460 [Breznakibacter sp.]